MSTQERETLDDTRRKARVNRIKKGIIGVLTFWMIFSLVAIIVLSVLAVSLTHRLNRLEKTILDGTAATSVSAKTKPDGEDAPADSGDKKTDEQSTENVGNPEEPSESVSDTESDSDEAVNMATMGIDSPENMAGAEDTHQVYLTFDGGPDENTDAILDVLKQYNVKATFFVSGDESSEMQAVYRRIVADGHTLGMRSYSNQYSEIYESEEAFQADFQKISDYLFKVTGLRSQYYRFLGGSGNEISNVEMSSLVHILNENDVTYFDWNVTADDLAADSTVEDVVSSVTKGVEKYKTSVVLLHEGTDRDITVEALGPLIEALQEMQAEILPIDDSTTVIQYIKADGVN